jgi:hypothetical protein
MEDYATAVSRLWRAMGEVEEGKVAFGRATRKLKDAEKIYEMDANNRELELLRSRAALEAERRKIMGEPEPETPGITKDAMQEMTNLIIEEYIQKRGGRSNLTPEDKEYIQTVRQKCDGFAKSY